MLVAMSATFWKASRKATAASTVVLGGESKGGAQQVLGTPGCAHGDGGNPCPVSFPVTHLSWECSLVALELKSSQTG